MSQQGLTVIQPAQATDDPSQIKDVDVVIVGVKAWQVSEAAEAMRPMIGPETFVVPLQNGVEAPSQLASVLGRERVLAGLCGTLSWVTAPGRIRNVRGTGFVKFGEMDNRRSERTERLRHVFVESGVEVEVPDDIEKALWEKFLLVTAFGGVGAVARAPIGVIRTLPETRQLLEQCMAEVLAVSQARKVTLSEGVIARTMGVIDGLDPSGTTSLQKGISWTGNQPNSMPGTVR